MTMSDGPYSWQVDAAARVTVGHTWNVDDPSEPITVDESQPTVPGDGSVDLRCKTCSETPTACRGRDGLVNLIVLQHEAGCSWLTENLERHAEAMATKRRRLEGNE